MLKWEDFYFCINDLLVEPNLEEAAVLLSIFFYIFTLNFFFEQITNSALAEGRDVKKEAE